MADLKRKSKSLKNGLKKKVKKERVSKKKLSKSAFKKNSFAGRQLDKGDGTNVVASYQKKIGKSVAREGRSKKKVKVSKALRAKIQKVFEKDVAQGWFKEIACKTDPIIPVDHDQVVEYLVDFSQEIFEPIAMFSPDSVLNAASALFNGSSPTFGGILVNATQTFPTDTLKVHVIESNAVYYLRNSTARGLQIRIYDVSPKGSLTTHPLGGQDSHDPIQFWTQSLLNQVPAVDNDLGTNPLGITPQTLGNSPKMDQGFAKHFSIDETIIYLEAGKEYYHKVPGVKDMLYDFAKFSVGGVYSNHQKMNKYTFVTVAVDLASRSAPAGTPQVGRVTNIAAPNGLLCECTLFTRFKMPEQAGLKVPTLPVAGQNLPLGYRRNAYAIKNYTSGTFTTADAYVNDEEPMAMLNPPTKI